MKDKIRAALRKMKLGKAIGPDSMSVELLEALEDYEIDKITTLLNENYDISDSTVTSKLIYIALPKKPGATDCEFHGAISLMSHATKYF